MQQVLVISIGGLGNQMFCYAFYKKLIKEYPEIHFKMDLSEIWDGRYERNAEILSVFPKVLPQTATAREIWQKEHKFTFTYRGKGSRFLRILVDNINRITMKSKKKFCITEELFEGYGRMILEQQWKEILYFDGFWQNIDDYKDCLTEVCEEFEFVGGMGEINAEYAKQMAEKESVAVHIRRGDYVGESLDILDTEYYTGIIKEIRSKNPESWFYFFSNDSEYVEREFAWLKEKTIVKNNKGLESFRDMQLMSLCKSNIIANSTFSIWAALLNVNAGRTVYYPSHYYKGIEMQHINLLGFVRVPVKEQERNCL